MFSSVHGQEASFVRSVIQNPGVHPFYFSSSVTIASSVSNVTLPKLRSITIFFPRGQSQIIYEFFQPLSDIEQVIKVRVT